MTAACRRPTICLIYARAANGTIGRDNAIPWHLPADMARFRQLTHGCPVVMGRKTWQSLPPRFRPLPGRTNIVVSRNAALDTPLQAAGALRADSVPAALALAAQHGDTIWVIGGAQIYAQALPLADRIEATVIHHPFEGDALAPEPGPQWIQTAREDHTSDQGWDYSFIRYEPACAATSP